MKRQKYRKEIIIKKYFALVVFESYQQFDLQISKLILEQKEEVHTVKKKNQLKRIKICFWRTFRQMKWKVKC